MRALAAERRAGRAVVDTAVGCGSVGRRGRAELRFGCGPKCGRSVVDSAPGYGLDGRRGWVELRFVAAYLRAGRAAVDAAAGYGPSGASHFPSAGSLASWGTRL